MSGFWARVRKVLFGSEEPRSDKASGRRGRGSDSPPRIIVGLDFGTSGSKVVLRNVTHVRQAPVAVDFGTPKSFGFTRFCFPSTVSLRGEELLFGVNAEKAADESDMVFRSLKRRLIRLDGRKTHPGPPIDLDQFGFSGIYQDSPSRVEEILATLYLAEVLCRVRTVLHELYGPVPEDRILIHLDVPIASLGTGTEEERIFTRMIRVARRLSKEGPEPSSSTLSAVASYFREVVQDLPDESLDPEAHEAVIPEAVAAIGGLGEAVPSSKTNRNFVVVDIGAGTTDLGFFRFTSKLEARAAFYSARTTAVGCDDVDQEICKALGIPQPGVTELATVRVGKSRLGRRPVPLFEGREPLTDDLLARSVESVAPRCRAAWEQAFRDAFKKEARENRWKRLDVFLVGGGSLIRPFHSLYRKAPGRVKTVKIQPLDADLRLKAAGFSDDPPSQSDMIFLLPALGLSLMPPDLPQVIHPSEVEPLKFNKGPTGLYDFDADDMFSK